MRLSRWTRSYLVRSCNQDTTNLFRYPRNAPHNFNQRYVQCVCARARDVQIKDLSVSVRPHLLEIGHAATRYSSAAQKSTSLYFVNARRRKRLREPRVLPSRRDFSPRREFPPVSFAEANPDRFSARSGKLRCAARIHGLSDGHDGEIYGFPSGFLSGALTVVLDDVVVVVVVNSALRYVAAIAGRGLACTVLSHTHARTHTRAHTYAHTYGEHERHTWRDVRGRAGHARCGAPTR